MLKRVCSLFLLLLVAVAFVDVAFAGSAAQPQAAGSDNPPPPPPIILLDTASMDPTADPCVDFYQYACGRWVQQHPVPADRASQSSFNVLFDRNQAILRGVLEKAAAPSPKRTPVEQKIGDYYASCMDEATIEKKGLAPIQPALDRINAIHDKAELAQVIAQLQKAGVDALFRFGAGQDAKNSARVIASAAQGGMGLPSSEAYSADDAKSVETREKYVAYLQGVLQQLGRPADKAAAEAHAVMALETALAKGSLSPVERRKPENRYNLIKTEELAALSPSFDWRTFYTVMGLGDLKEINAAPPSFFKQVEEQIGAAPLDDWKAYLRTRLVTESSLMLPSAFQNLRFDFYEKFQRGVKEPQPRWERCAESVDRNLGEALGQKYVEAAFGEKNRQRMDELVAALRTSLQQDIQGLDWMGEATKKEALVKLSKMDPKIGYPKKWRDYSSLKVVRGDALGNLQRAQTFALERRLERIAKGVDPDEWTMTPPTVNASYRSTLNDITFPAGILQPPFFDVSADDAVNFGGIGAVIGHEMTHGFDDQGRKSDAQGNLRDWWTPTDAKAFEERAACVDRQYSDYVAVDDVHVNGKLTMGENLADLGGIRIAYRALHNELGGKEPPKKEGFTADQRFFLAFGQVWCSNATPEALRQQALTNPHSPGRYRAIGVVSNMPEFQQAFSCKAGQPMVRQEVCRVW